MIKKLSEMRVETREKMKGGDGAVTVVHLLEKMDFTARTRLCAKLILPPGTGIGQHKHDSEDEVFMITKGSGLLEEGSSEFRVSAGDVTLTGRGGSHAIRNDGDGDLEIIALIMCY